MTQTEAINFSEDIKKELDDDSYIDSVYLSINGVGTKTFKECKCDQLEGWVFIWTKEGSYFFNEEDIGDFVLIDATNPELSLI